MNLSSGVFVNGATKNWSDPASFLINRRVEYALKDASVRGVRRDPRRIYSRGALIDQGQRGNGWVEEVRGNEGRVSACKDNETSHSRVSSAVELS